MNNRLQPSISELRYLAVWQVELQKSYLQLLVLASLAESPKHMAQLSYHLAQLTDNVILPRQVSLYRGLKRWEVSGLIKFDLTPSPAGPAYKEYHLTVAGDRILKAFIERNGSVLIGKKIEKLLRDVS